MWYYFSLDRLRHHRGQFARNYCPPARHSVLIVMRCINTLGACLLSATCLLTALGVHAQEDEEFESAATQTLRPADRAAARLKMLEPAPVDSLRNILEEFFKSRKVLSERQGDLAASEQLLVQHPFCNFPEQ